MINEFLVSSTHYRSSCAFLHKSTRPQSKQVPQAICHGQLGCLAVSSSSTSKHHNTETDLEAQPLGGSFPKSLSLLIGAFAPEAQIFIHVMTRVYMFFLIFKKPDLTRPLGLRKSVKLVENWIFLLLEDPSGYRETPHSRRRCAGGKPDELNPVPSGRDGALLPQQNGQAI
ncbi:hypothetical protein PGT21_005668 [Puccinia graminis f. sp. tritici]|uniref:Uncharacterized protein n=1 Tax=Puccinia graminis f. sp. tritici TaxID=56615 RepID=A0A5B0N6G4_PUCGR|nr:hypothetical protein PGT21_005668 [Puccinia graminis f. sp. tritici]KAA1122914.1 hypothetical protein PGTUg99_013246 [Puccinia graminis f. sp. tritici]